MVETNNKFHIAKTDANGHFETLEVQVPLSYIRAINTALENGCFPYACAGDVARDAMYRGLAWMATVDPDVGDILEIGQEDVLPVDELTDDYLLDLESSLQKAMKFMGRKARRTVINSARYKCNHIHNGAFKESVLDKLRAMHRQYVGQEPWW